MADTSLTSTFDPPAPQGATQPLEAAEPPEARGLRRDEVRLLVSDIDRDLVEHARFRDLPSWLSAGDLLVVNTSATLNAAISATTADDEVFDLHLSTQLPGGFWTIEIRQPGQHASVAYNLNRVGTTFRLPDEGRATVLAPYPTDGSIDGPSRLWMAAVRVPGDVSSYLDRHGVPIRYGYVRGRWPSEMYQTVFALEPGSAEMPSAGRPFTPELIAHLVSRGVQIAPLVLHTGVASLEHDESPYEEFYRVPATTAERVNAARRSGHHVVAVGTTVVRALETVTDEHGVTAAGQGWTRHVVTPDQPPRAVTALITGFHEARASHLRLIEAVASAGSRVHAPDNGERQVPGALHLARAYREAMDTGYLWHEFGDSHLILGRRPTRDGSTDR